MYGESAIRKFFELQHALEDFERQHIDPVSRAAAESGVGTYSIPGHLMAEHLRLKNAVHEFGCILNSVPEFQDILVNWNVQVSGTHSLSKDVVNRLIECGRGGRAKEAFGLLGGIPLAVYLAIEGLGFQMTRKEANKSMWSIHSHTSEGASRRLTAVLHRQFAKAIAKEIIVVRRSFVGYQMPSVFDPRHQKSS